VASKIGRVGGGGEQKIAVRDGERKSGVRSRLEILSGLSFLWFGRKVNRGFAISFCGLEARVWILERTAYGAGGLGSNGRRAGAEMGMAGDGGRRVEL